MSFLPHRSLLASTALAFAAGCFVHVDRSPETELVTFDTPIESVLVDVQNGDVVIRRGWTAEVQRTWWGPRPVLLAGVTDGVLEVVAECEPRRSCRTEHVITLPEGVNVDVLTGSGDVQVADVRSAGLWTGSGDVEVQRVEGRVYVETGSGDVDVADIGGDLSVLTGSGDVVAERLWSSQVEVETGSGDVDLHMTVVPTRLAVETRSGDLTVELVQGRYDLRTRTGSGTVRVTGVTIDAGADSMVDLETGSGDIHVTGR